MGVSNFSHAKSQQTFNWFKFNLGVHHSSYNFSPNTAESENRVFNENLNIAANQAILMGISASYKSFVFGIDLPIPTNQSSDEEVTESTKIKTKGRAYKVIYNFKNHLLEANYSQYRGYNIQYNTDSSSLISNDVTPWKNLKHEQTKLSYLVVLKNDFDPNKSYGPLIGTSEFKSNHGPVIGITYDKSTYASSSPLGEIFETKSFVSENEINSFRSSE